MLPTIKSILKNRLYSTGVTDEEIYDIAVRIDQLMKLRDFFPSLNAEDLESRNLDKIIPLTKVGKTKATEWVLIEDILYYEKVKGVIMLHTFHDQYSLSTKSSFENFVLGDEFVFTDIRTAINSKKVRKYDSYFNFIVFVDDKDESIRKQVPCPAKVVNHYKNLLGVENDIKSIVGEYSKLNKKLKLSF